jgi:hypothetical protein
MLRKTLMIMAIKRSKEVADWNYKERDYSFAKALHKRRCNSNE